MNVQRRGVFYLVAGPAGAGKSTVIKQWVAGATGLVKAVSATTRAPRAGERNGIEYHFWDTPRFETAAKNGELLEYAQVHGSNYYGTPAAYVRQALDAGLDVVKDIDVQGVDLIRALPGWGYPVTVSVFIKPPSWDELVRRLSGRGTETPATLEARLQSAREEMARADSYDHAVVNDTVQECVARLAAIRLSEQCRKRDA